MQSRSLRAFLALKQYRTVAAAAKAIHLSPAAVSVQLKNLEIELGLDLFVRTGRSISLNPAANQLAPLAQEMLDLLAKMHSLSNAQTLKGQISLGVIHSTMTGGLPEVLKRLAREHPELEVRVVANNSPELLTWVESGIIDYAIVSHPPAPLHATLIMKELYEEPLAIVFNESMNFKGVKEFLESSPYIAFDRKTWTGKKIESFLREKQIAVHLAMELDSHDAVLSMVRHGMGVSILPMIHRKEFKLNGLKFHELTGMHRKICLAVRKPYKDSKLSALLVSHFHDLDNPTYTNYPV